MKRNTTISIAKGFAIIFMVMAHADCPGALMSFIYEFHMPLFFITAGYFFSLKYLDNEATFVKKRIKGLYWPFVKWATFFLIIHNWMFDLGILNEKYGNWTGGVTHPYSWHQIQQNFWNIITAMAGYDQFLCGAFWFFRGLFVASIAYLILYKFWMFLANRVNIKKWRVNTETKVDGDRLYDYIGLAVCITILILCGWKTSEGLRVINLVQGGYRDMMGVFFFGCGFLFRRHEHLFKDRWWAIPVCFVVVLLFSIYGNANMNWRSTFNQFMDLPITALMGFWMMYLISSLVDKRDNILKRTLVYCGDNTLYVFIFHIISFKLVSLIKIWYYGLDYQQIGCHMAIHEHAGEDLFWILYTIVGVGLPLTWHYYYVKIKHTLSEKRAQ